MTSSVVVFFSTNLSLDYAHEISSWSDEVLYLSNYDVIMEAPMISSLTYFIPHWEFFTMSHVSIFSIQHFRRYGGANFFGFSKMGDEPRDRWRHHFFFLHQFMPTWRSINFILIGWSFVLVELWRHNGGTYDIIINMFYSPWRVLYNEQCLNFFYSALSEIKRCNFFRFSQDGGRNTWPMTSSLFVF